MSTCYIIRFNSMNRKDRKIGKFSIFNDVQSDDVASCGAKVFTKRRDAAEYNASRLNSERRFRRACSARKVETIAFPVDVKGSEDKYFHRGFYDRRDRSSERRAPR